MKHARYRRIFLGFSTCLTTISLYVMTVSAQNVAPLEQLLKVSANLPLTGDLAIYGQSVQEGVTFYINQNKSLKKDIYVDYNWGDNRSMPSEALTVVKRQFALAKPDVYISGVRPQYLAISDEIKRSGLPHFAWIFDVDLRNDPGPLFRTWVNFKVESPLFLDYAEKIKAQKIAIIYVSLPSTDIQYQNVIIPSLQSKGKEVQVQNYQMEVTDFNAMALKVKKFKPDLIILSGFQHNFISMIKTLRRYKLINQNNTVATYDLLDASLHLPAAAIENIRVSTPKFLLSKEPNVIKWRQDFKEHFGKAPDYTQAYAFDMAHVLQNLADKAKGNFSSENLGILLDNTSLQGITGELKFIDGDVLPSVTLGVFKNGVLLED